MLDIEWYKHNQIRPLHIVFILQLGGSYKTSFMMGLLQSGNEALSLSWKGFCFHWFCYDTFTPEFTKLYFVNYIYKTNEMRFDLNYFSQLPM